MSSGMIEMERFAGNGYDSAIRANNNVVKNCTFHPVQIEWFKRTFGLAPLGVNATEAELRRQNTLREVLAQMEQRVQV